MREWRGRRVLVTGHTGFKGGWLTLWLQRMGAHVSGLALPPDSSPNLFEGAHLASTVSSHFVDVRDTAAVADVVRDEAPEVVFHLAAQPLVRRSYLDPLETFSTNVMGTANVLSALHRVTSVKAVVVVTTDKVYENREWDWSYREVDTLGGHDPYSASKACAEIVAASWRRSFGHSVPWRMATARAGNVIGGGDWSVDRLVPDLARGAISRQPVPIRNPLAIRPWQHVVEPLAGYLRLAEALLERSEAEGAWNFGPDASDQRPVREVADLFAWAWGPDCRWVQDSGAHPHEARALALDSTRARNHLGWRPRLDLEAAVHWTVEWYRGVHERMDAREAVLRQIERYEELSTP